MAKAAAKPKKEIKANCNTEPEKQSQKNNIIEQMADGIVGKETDNQTEEEKKSRRNLTGRAMEYLMFMDDE